jgi:hypothetical protein
MVDSRRCQWMAGNANQRTHRGPPFPRSETKTKDSGANEQVRNREDTGIRNRIGDSDGALVLSGLGSVDSVVACRLPYLSTYTRYTSGLCSFLYSFRRRAVSGALSGCTVMTSIYTFPFYIRLLPQMAIALSTGSKQNVHYPWTRIREHKHRHRHKPAKHLKQRQYILLLARSSAP